MDYAMSMKREIFKTTLESNADMLSRLETESDVIVASLEMVTLSPDVVMLTEASESKSFFTKIKEFFKKIFNVFISKAKDLFSLNDKWLAENKDRLLSMQLDGYDISMIPYWNVSFNDVKSFFNESLRNLFKFVNNILNKIKLRMDDAAKVSDKDKLKFRPLEKYAGKDISATIGYKNYLRHGKTTEAQHIKVSGSNLKNVVKDAIEFCLSYNKTIVPYLKSQLSHIESEIKQIESTISSVKESTIFIENSHICESSLSYLPGFNIIREAEENKSNTSVDINRPDKKNKDDEEKHEGEVVKVSYANKSRAELRYIEDGMAHSKLILTSAMTVMEEKYSAYMKLLRGLEPDAKKEKQENKITKIQR